MGIIDHRESIVDCHQEDDLAKDAGTCRYDFVMSLKHFRLNFFGVILLNEISSLLLFDSK